MKEVLGEVVDLGLTRTELELGVEQHGFAHGWLDSAYSDYPNFEAERAKMIATIDSFLKLFEIENNWINQLVRVRQGEYNNRLEDLRKNLSDNDQQSPGSVVYNLFYYDLDIECEEDGYGSAELNFGTSNGYEVTIYLHGDFWTDRSYERKDGEVVFYSGDSEMTEELELELSGDPNYETDAEVGFSVRAEFRINRTETT